MSHAHVPQSSTVLTPTELAAAMVAAARGKTGATWLDPCVGDGAFVAQIAARHVAPDSITAIDIAPGPGSLDSAAQTKRGVDFLEWASGHWASVDHVVMNPPYVALNRLKGKLLDRALSVCLADGKPLSLKANYWAAFLAAAVGCVREGGSLVAVLPAAWDFAKYASRVRDSVVRAFGEVNVVRCASPLFPRVQEGVVIVAAFQRGTRNSIQRRIEVPNLPETIVALEQIAEGRVSPHATTMRSFAPPLPTLQRLDELVHIHIGAVTGDAGYFLLNDEERKRWGLPRSAVRPVLSRSSHLTASTMNTRAWEQLRDRGARVWMFSPTSSALKHRAVEAYLEHGENGGCNIKAHKIARRDPWYRPPLPGRIDGFVSGMSRRLPFVVLRTMPGLTASNTLYVIRFKRRVTTAEKATLGLVLLTSAVRKELALHARVYADGLLKFEPADLGAVRIPMVHPRRGAWRVLQKATAALLAGREAEASAMADAWVSAAVLATEHRRASSKRSVA